MMETAGVQSSEPVARPQTAESRPSPDRPRRIAQEERRPGRDDARGIRRGLQSAARSNGSRKMTKVFKALSDNTRQEILQILDGEQYTVSEIVSCFDLSQPTISRHLSVLKDAELVVDRRRGQNILYRLNDRTLTASMRQFFGRFQSCQEALR